MVWERSTSPPITHPGPMIEMFSGGGTGNSTDSGMGGGADGGVDGGAGSGAGSGADGGAVGSVGGGADGGADGGVCATLEVRLITGLLRMTPPLKTESSPNRQLFVVDEED